MLVLFVYITRLASKEIFSPSNKRHREVGRAKDLSTPLYNCICNKGLLEECDREENVKSIGVVTTSCLKRGL
jgi:hypothetical protein